jgi:stage V sporulation protein AC
MRPTNKEYSKLTKKMSPPSPKLKDMIWAFCVGGLICVIGQLSGEFYKSVCGLSEEIVKMLIPVTLIFLSALLTGLKLFDKIAKRAGAGTLVPITGFANAVVSPAIEFKSEGFVLGLGAKMFTIAGPVIVYGTVASVVYGFIYWIITII